MRTRDNTLPSIDSDPRYLAEQKKLHELNDRLASLDEEIAATPSQQQARQRDVQRLVDEPGAALATVTARSVAEVHQERALVQQAIQKQESILNDTRQRVGR